MKPYAARAKVVQFFDRLNTSRSGECGIQLPATVAARTSAAPISDASTTRPLRMRYMYKPTNSAIGIVQAMVNVPHELPAMINRVLSGKVMTPSCEGDSSLSLGSCTENASPHSTASLVD